MGKESVTFINIESEQNKFYHRKTPVFRGECRFRENISI